MFLYILLFAQSSQNQVLQVLQVFATYSHGYNLD